jgi:hypothetical protein
MAGAADWRFFQYAADLAAPGPRTEREGAFFMEAARRAHSFAEDGAPKFTNLHRRLPRRGRRPGFAGELPKGFPAGRSRILEPVNFSTIKGHKTS